jgi:hypothetical protein
MALSGSAGKAAVPPGASRAGLYSFRFRLNPVNSKLVAWALPRKLFDRLLLAACISVLCAILIAGLWPFNPLPKNEVRWAASGRGLRFGDHGIVLSRGSFEVKGSPDGSCSIAIWLEPDAAFDTSVILDFYSPEDPWRFRIQQEDDSLRVLRDVSDEGGKVRTPEVNVQHAFRGGVSVLIAVSATPESTSVYLNGALAKTSATLGLTSRDLRGEMIIGNSPVEYETWRGLLKGLAIYNRGLSALEMQQMYEAWKLGVADGSMEKSEPFALYLFNEHEGTVIRDQMASGPDLTIPVHFQTVGHAFLRPFWKEYYPGPGYWKDIGINIGGFVPFGFFFLAYLVMVRRAKKPVLTTILLGTATSLTIEVLQAFIPTRTSGTTDLITNTLGTALGAFLCGTRGVTAVMARVVRAEPGSREP